MEGTCVDCSDPESSHGRTGCLSPFWLFHDCTERTLARNAAPHLPSIKKRPAMDDFSRLQLQSPNATPPSEVVRAKTSTKKHVLTLRCCQSVQKKNSTSITKRLWRERSLKWFQRHNSSALFFFFEQGAAITFNMHNTRCDFISPSSRRRWRIGWNRWRIKSPTNLRWHFIVIVFSDNYDNYSLRRPFFWKC